MFTIQRTQPAVYLDNAGNAVNGFKVTVYYPEFDETQFIEVPTLDPATVNAEATKLYEQRKALADLGAPQVETTEA